MRTLHPAFLSRTRQKIAAKLEEVKRLCMEMCTDELLFHGKPGEVYRKCGKANCKCAEGRPYRHGPYRIIRVFRDNKNTQVTITAGETEFLEMARRYQEEIKRRRRILAIEREILSILDELLKDRTIWNKAEYKDKQ